MADLTGNANGTFTGILRKLEGTDRAIPTTWDDEKQKLIDNDAILNRRLGTLEALNIQGRLQAIEANDFVITARIANGAVTGAKIANQTIGANNIQTGAVGSNELADNISLTSLSVGSSTLNSGNMVLNNGLGGASLQIGDDTIFEDMNITNALRLRGLGDPTVADLYMGTNNARVWHGANLRFFEGALGATTIPNGGSFTSIVIFGVRVGDFVVLSTNNFGGNNINASAYITSNNVVSVDLRPGPDYPGGYTLPSGALRVLVINRS